MAIQGINPDGAKVLVVDDERHIARFLEFVLKKAGYEVALAYNGEQALAAVEAFDPDVVLLDLVLPGLTGLEVLKRLRADSGHAALAVMVLSAQSLGEVPAELREAGANAHCTKPIAPSTLLKKLAALGVPPSVQGPGPHVTPGRGA
ncbi:MAG: response regulator [Candidatus Tectomicrobia bacterium]|jgi:DNA-binding response OmpR family regulator|nr:response regulator [Candidatus Tectomicrobia bacterium]